MVDDLARELNVDPFELRLKNAAKPDDPMINDQLWTKMGMTQVLENLREHPTWQNRADARVKGRGIGFAVGGWPGGTGPASAACKLERDGTLRLDLGSVDISGTNTGFVLMAAEVFGVFTDQIRVDNSDTKSSSFALNAGGRKSHIPLALQSSRRSPKCVARP